MDLFTATPYRPDPYPVAPGYREGDTSRKAAESVADRVELLRDRCLALIRAAGANGLTADETAERLAETPLSIRPRCTELLRLGAIRDSGFRRKNASGRSAKVWRVA